MQIVTVAGAVGKDAETRSTQGGDQFCTFSVAGSSGWGDRKQTTWWDVTKWGKGADKLAAMILKGVKVTVSGEVSTREHNGKTYLQIRADYVDVQGERRGDANRQSEGQGKSYSRGEEGYIPGFDDDSPVPF